jgi:GNAT superfamily N-acetyltransferase
VVVRLLTPAETSRRTGEFVDLYREVYAEPPYHEGEEQVAGFVERFAAESGNPGFTVVAAEDGGGGLVGYAYGVAFDPDQWWDDADTYPPGLRGLSKLAIMELAVRAPLRGKGIGTALMAALRRARPEPCWTLCAHPASVARRIYDRWGWRQVTYARPPGMPVLDVLILYPDPDPGDGALQPA